MGHQTTLPWLPRKAGTVIEGGQNSRGLMARYLWTTQTIWRDFFFTTQPVKNCQTAPQRGVRRYPPWFTAVNWIRNRGRDVDRVGIFRFKLIGMFSSPRKTPKRRHVSRYRVFTEVKNGIEIQGLGVEK